MSGNAVYKHTEGSSLLKKLATWRNYFTDEEFVTAQSESKDLLETIQQARQEWLSAVANFDQAENEDMIDYYIYRMKACQVRYNYLLKKAKEVGLRHDSYEAQ